MLNLLTLIFACLLGLVLPFVQPCAEEPAPIVVLDVPRILTESKIGKAASAAVKKEQEVKQKEVNRLKQQVENLKADFQKQGTLLSESALKEKRAKLQSKDEELRTTVMRVEQELRKLNTDQVDKVMVEVDRILADLADERGFAYVLDRDPRTVLYRREELDLTDQVIAKLGK